MSQTYQFTRAMLADGPDGMPRKFADGETIDKADILAGCLESCLRTGDVVVFAEPEPASEAPAEPDPPKPVLRTRR